MNSKICNFYVIIILVLKYTVKAVPPDYCLHKLNTSDCQGTPTPVFSYYKPGSRCEIEIWRGCPTYNKFDNEYLCSNYCLFSFIKSAETTAMVRYNNTDQCSYTITEPCKSNPQNIAYTFNTEKQECLPIIWGECKTPNIFKGKNDCLATCLSDWKTELANLTKDEFNDIGEVLSNFNKKLKVMDEVNLASPTTQKEVVTTLEVTVPETVVTEEETTETITTELVTVTEEVTTEEITTTTTESVTDEATTTEVPTTTRRLRTMGTDYVSEVQLPY